MRKRQAAAIVVLGAGLVMTLAVHAQRGGGTAPKPMALTALDYIEIQQLVVRYSKAIDSCANNGYDYADLYTPDGWFGSSREGVLGDKFQGRERLAEAAGGGLRRSASQRAPAQPSR